jgi:hypothetical protein
MNGILDFLGGGGDSAAMSIQQQMLRDAQNIPLPILKEYYPELYQVVSQMNPELETAVNLGPSAMAGISTDPALRQAQMNALSKLESIGLGGQSAEDQARMANITNDINTNLQGQQGAIMQNLAQRGMSGGGSELAQRSMAAQGAANRQASMAMDAKAQAERRALDAIMQSGQLGGQMQSQDFQQQQAKAQAADAISRFNAQNQQNVIGANVGAKNQAQMYNAGMQNQTAAQNTESRNQAQQRNLNLAQQEYENKLKKLGIVSNAQSGMADTYRNQANQNRQFIGGLIGAGAQAYAGMPSKPKGAG